ncbi:MAG: alpha-L-glutamate ligase [Deltaproteobacteria bacterium SG8_13]|nr:MAG: alpha-L-glutamate ligase [Deltaproteobacteria bacterium SG8_13]
MLWGAIKKLHKSGLLGINCRNANYTLKYNLRKRYPLVDDKLLTKAIAIRAGLSVPDLYAVVEFQHQIESLPDLLSGYSEFAVKPSRGSGGNGIVVISGRIRERLRKAGGQLVSMDDLKFHVHNILSGMFSLGGQQDKAMFEYRVRFDPVFEPVTFQGVPDLRIIVFLGFPTMAMVRLPTMMSGGKANLHQGAIGVGIDMATGRTLNAVWRNEVIEEHPDTGNPVGGIQIPHWEKLLRLAAECYELTGLGYIGVDLVLDATRGPLILELNARPGLSIQLANHRGLLPRLKKVESVCQDLADIDARVNFSMNHFRHSTLQSAL